jgi:trimethylamine:corrinoid methyltransferase-like protein
MRYWRGLQRRDASALAQLPWRVPRNPYRPLEVLSEDQVEAIHDASLRILRRIRPRRRDTPDDGPVSASHRHPKAMAIVSAV